MASSGPEYRENAWWVSPYNFTSEVRSKMELPHRVEIHDATLRDGEQTPGVVLRVEDKVEIARMLDAVGIERIEAGMPAVSRDDFQAITEIARLERRAKIFAFTRARIEDIDQAIDAGVDGVVIEVPIGKPKLQLQFGWTWREVLDRSLPVIEHAKKQGLNVVFFPYDTTRADIDELDQLVDGVMSAIPPDSIGVVDTMGCATPEAMKFLVRHVKKRSGLPIEVHTHNDFGMAVATELAGVESGAEVVHGCINGLGERTGNAATEELAMALKVLYGFDVRYDLTMFTKIAEIVSRATNIPIADNKPVIGRRNFTRESGIGVDLVLKKPLAMFATAPSLTGRSGDIVLGKKSGKLSVQYKLDELGIEGVSDEAVVDIVSHVKALGIEKRGLVTDEEFSRIVEKVRSN